jgi:ATP-dependent DNA ligase
MRRIERYLAMPSRIAKVARRAKAPYPALTIAPMEARLAEALPLDEGWQFEPKWDGFRCLAHKHGAKIDLRGRSGKSLNRFFPDVVALIAKIKTPRCVIDGELMIVAQGASSFEALQARLHPAESRVAKLAASQPAHFVAFDCLARGAASLIDERLAERRAALEQILKLPPPGVVLSPFVSDVREAHKWLARSGRALDGVVAKRVDGAYLPGERAMVKVKRIRSADCVVGGFRYGAGTQLVGSLLLGLYDDDGRLHHVGFTAAFKNDERAAITNKLRALIGASAFTGRAPGGPSRWSTERSEEWVALKPRLVVEVSFDQVTDDRFRHGARLLRWRPDKAAKQCTFEQLRPPAPPAEFSQSFAK